MLNKRRYSSDIILQCPRSFFTTHSTPVIVVTVSETSDRSQCDIAPWHKGYFFSYYTVPWVIEKSKTLAA